MSDITLGKILKRPQARDAIHLAVAPVLAGEILKPAQRVCLVEGKAVSEVRYNAIGIVDPFLRTDVAKGQIFWLCLFQGTITSLRHEWTHPAFSSDAQADAAVADLTRFAERVGCNYVDLVERLDLYADDSCGQDDEIQGGLNALQDEGLVRNMWDAYEIIRRTEVPKQIKSSTYFRCAC